MLSIVYTGTCVIWPRMIIRNIKRTQRQALGFPQYQEQSSLQEIVEVMTDRELNISTLYMFMCYNSAVTWLKYC